MRTICVEEVCGLCEHLQMDDWCHPHGHLLLKDKRYECELFELKHYLTEVVRR